MMKSVVVTAPHSYEIREGEIPKITQEHDVLVKLQAVGVCGSDIHTYLGENASSKYPIILGHELAGIVTDVGSAVTRVKKGSRVVIEQYNACGECYACRIGHPNVCESLKVRGSSMDGGYREYLICPDQAVYPLPDSLSFVEGAMVEPFTIAMQCTSHVGLTADDTVLVFGAGTIGSTIIQVCHNKGATVIAADISQDNLRRAQKYGAKYVINTAEKGLAEAIGEITGGHGVTLAIDSCCFKNSLTMLLEPGIICNAGRLLNLGFGREAEAITPFMLTGREIDLISSRLQAGKYPDTIRAFEEKKFQLEDLVTHQIPFSEIDKVFSNMEHPSPSVKKMVILFS